MRIGPYTPEEDKLLQKRKAEGIGNEAIARELDRTINSVKSRRAVLMMRARHAAARGAEEPRISRRHVPDEVWAERNSRMLEPISITSFVFGDPSPSRSALAQRRA